MAKRVQFNRVWVRACVLVKEDAPHNSQDDSCASLMADQWLIFVVQCLHYEEEEQEEKKRHKELHPNHLILSPSFFDRAFRNQFVRSHKKSININILKCI